MNETSGDVESQLPWISEVALKKFDYADRAFDTINTRAGIVIGWSSLLTAIFFPALDRLPILNKAIVLISWSLPFFCMMHQGYMAFSVANLKALPLTEVSLDELISLSNLEARSKVIMEIVTASELNEAACIKKARYLKNAIKWFYCELLILSLTLILLSFWPKN